MLTKLQNHPLHHDKDLISLPKTNSCETINSQTPAKGVGNAEKNTRHFLQYSTAGFPPESLRNTITLVFLKGKPHDFSWKWSQDFYATESETYCWWFRNPKQPPGVYKTLQIMG